MLFSRQMNNWQRDSYNCRVLVLVYKTVQNLWKHQGHQLSIWCNIYV